MQKKSPKINYKHFKAYFIFQPCFKICPVLFENQVLLILFVLYRPRHAKKSVFGHADSSDQGHHSPLRESLDTIEYMNGEQRPG